MTMKSSSSKCWYQGKCVLTEIQASVSLVRGFNPAPQNSCFKVALERKVKDHLLTALLGNYNYLYAVQR